MPITHQLLPLQGYPPIAGQGLPLRPQIDTLRARGSAQLVGKRDRESFGVDNVDGVGGRKQPQLPGLGAKELGDVQLAREEVGEESASQSLGA